MCVLSYARMTLTMTPWPWPRCKSKTWSPESRPVASLNQSQTQLTRPVATGLGMQRVPWLHLELDLYIMIMQKNLHAYQNEVCRSKHPKIRAQTGLTDRHTDRHDWNYHHATFAGDTVNSSAIINTHGFCLTSLHFCIELLQIEPARGGIIS